MIRHDQEQPDPGEQDAHHKGIYSPTIVRAQAAVLSHLYTSFIAIMRVDIVSNEAMDASSSDDRLPGDGNRCPGANSPPSLLK
jgi:hypothetical protein